MINKTKFNTLTRNEKNILGESIGLPDYENDDVLIEELDRLWEEFAAPYRKEGFHNGVNVQDFITIVSKLN